MLSLQKTASSLRYVVKEDSTQLHVIAGEALHPYDEIHIPTLIL